MNAAQARRILTPGNGDEGVKYGSIAAQYYLECYEKARGLEEALENFLIGYDLGQFKIIYKEPAPTKGIVPIFKEALAKFRGAI